MNKFMKVVILVLLIIAFVIGIIVILHFESNEENSTQEDIIEADYTDDNSRPIKMVELEGTDITIDSLASLTSAEEEKIIGTNSTAKITYEDGEVVTKPCYIVRTIDKELKEIKYTDGNYIKIELPLNAD